MISHLAMEDRPPSCGRVKRRPKGWTPERRAGQAAHARRSQPWRHSTGPRTDAGKARVAMNAFRHGYCGRTWLLKARRIRHAIRLCAQTVLLVRLHLRQQDRFAARTHPAGLVPHPTSPSWGEPAPDLFGGRSAVARKREALRVGGSAERGFYRDVSPKRRATTKNSVLTQIMIAVQMMPSAASSGATRHERHAGFVVA